jgi:hypothetical protein
VRRGRAEPERGPSARATADAGARDDGEDDPIERMARSGFAALERFGMELEAVFAGSPVEAPARPPADPAAEPAPAPPVATTAERRLAELDIDLARRLAEEGVVVRGYDIARVVAVATGQSVRWEP